MRRVPAALVALASAATLVVLALPASAAGARSFRVSPATVHAGQQVKVFGKGCGSQALVRIYLSGIEIDDDRADRAGAFNDEVEIPASVDPGQYLMKAGCSGRGLGSVKLTALRSRFGVSPRSVAPGGTIKVTGSACKPGSYATIKLDGRHIEDGHANRTGKFSIRAQVPSGTSEDTHRVSARRHGRFVGSQLIEVVEPYPAPRSLLTLDRTAVPAGQAVKGAKAGRDARRRSQHGQSEVVGTGPDAAVGAVQLHAKDITWDGFLIRENFAGPGMHTSPSASKYDVRNPSSRTTASGSTWGRTGRARATCATTSSSPTTSSPASAAAPASTPAKAPGGC